jgi:hypothetical protein
LFNLQEYLWKANGKRNEKKNGVTNRGQLTWSFYISGGTLLQFSLFSAGVGRPFDLAQGNEFYVADSV